MASAEYPNRTPIRLELPTVKQKLQRFYHCQPFYFNGTEGAVGLIPGLNEPNQYSLIADVLKKTNIEGNVTAFKPQTLEESINIAQRLMDQVTKHVPMQVSSDNKRKFDDRRTFYNNSCSNNNYRNTNNCYNNRQNQRQEAGRAYAVTPSENSRPQVVLETRLKKIMGYHQLRAREEDIPRLLSE
ncbi:hypothetical protein Tco_0460812 [Tanacetum coccineum]